MRLGLCSVYHFSQYTGGNERYLHELAVALSALGHQVSYFTGTKVSQKKLPYQIIPLNLFHFQNKPLPLLNRLDLQITPIDLLHTSGSGLPIHLFARGCSRLGIPTVHTYQAHLHPQTSVGKVGAKLESWLISRSYRRLITTTPYYQESLTYLYPQIPVSLIPLMLPSPFLAALPLRSKPASHPSLLFVGTLDQHHYYKGLEVLLQAMVYTPEEFHLTVVGSGSSQLFYETIAKNLGVKDRVSFTGKISDLRLIKLYQCAKVYVQPATSDSEGFGLSLLEAMALKVPAVTSASAISSVSKFKHLITTVVPNHPQALARAIIQLIKLEPHTQINQAFSYARSLTPQAIATETLAVYYNL